MVHLTLSLNFSNDAEQDHHNNSMRGVTSVTCVIHLLTLLFTVTQIAPNMPQVNDLLNITTLLRFVAPPLLKSQWEEINSEIKEILSPTQFGLSNNVITPQEAGQQFSLLLYNYFKDKPEFIQNKTAAKGHQKNSPKTLNEARKIKNALRKKIHLKDASTEDRKNFGMAVRFHNHLLKEQRKRDKANS